ncbi:MAG: Asp-tRNA(Asn)/Glu-tRNA(Gln) amidotransferase subunit GatC [Nitrospirota bacterium]|nr:MAG: Asp-tRNA(Asn)/Glu-tRNA(Gln) amidotransferase subunit GatC [Nitrospirota bacterium]
MNISRDDVTHIATLSRLKLSEQEIEQFREQLSGILSYVENLNSLDTKGVIPTSHVIDVNNVMREDVMRPSLSAEHALFNAPDNAESFYKVPKIID